MAEENAAAEQSEETPEEGGRFKFIRIRIPPIVVRISIIGGILAVLAVGAIFLVTEVIGRGSKRMGATPVAEEQVEKVERAKKGEPVEVLNVSDLIVNPAGTGGRRYLKVAAAIEVRPEKDKKAKKSESQAAGLVDVQVRDLLIRELSARNLDELTDPTAKEETRQSLLAELNELLGEGR